MEAVRHLQDLGSVRQERERSTFLEFQRQSHNDIGLIAHDQVKPQLQLIKIRTGPTLLPFSATTPAFLTIPSESPELRKRIIRTDSRLYNPFLENYRQGTPDLIIQSSKTEPPPFVLLSVSHTVFMRTTSVFCCGHRLVILCGSEFT